MIQRFLLPPLSLGVQQELLLTEGIANQIRHRVRVQFFHEVRAVRGDRLKRNPQVHSDLFARPAGGYQV
jgi:hypothetical protein